MPFSSEETSNEQPTNHNTSIAKEATAETRMAFPARPAGEEELFCGC